MSANPSPNEAAAGPAALDGGDPFLATALDLLQIARPLAQRYFRQPLAVERKADASPVTLADRSIEAALRARLSERHPDHAIYGEEHGSVRLGARHTWVIDPIDGTKSFIAGMPLFGTLLALLDQGRPVLGAIDMPALNETWIGRSGRPSTFNGRACRTAQRTNPADCILFATSPDIFEGEARTAFERVSANVGMRRFGGDCYAYGLLASGHVDLVVEAGLQPYDYLPLVPVIEGAGGRITDWQGAPLGLQSDGRVVVAANAALHQWALDRLAG